MTTEDMLKILFLVLSLDKLVLCHGNIIRKETREIYAGINRDGSFLDSTTNLICSYGHKIVLLNYHFLQLNCTSFDECLAIRKAPLLSEEELILYRKCSLQTKCEDLKFSARSERNTPNTLYIKYKCIAETVVYDICGNFTKAVTEVAYLTYGTRGQFRKCRCFADTGNFKMIFSDIRLIEKTKDKCSAAEFKVNARTFVCDERKDGFGSVFNNSVQWIMPSAYISVILNSDVTCPENILLTLKPEDSIELSCQVETPIQRNLAISSTEKVGTYSLQGTSTSHTWQPMSKCGDHQTREWTHSEATTWILILLAFMILVQFIKMFVTWCRKKPTSDKEMAETKKQSKQSTSVDIADVATTPDTVPISSTSSRMDNAIQKDNASENIEKRDDGGATWDVSHEVEEQNLVSVSAYQDNVTHQKRKQKTLDLNQAKYDRRSKEIRYTFEQGNLKDNAEKVLKAKNAYTKGIQRDTDCQNLEEHGTNQLQQKPSADLNPRFNSKFSEPADIDSNIGMNKNIPENTVQQDSVDYTLSSSNATGGREDPLLMNNPNNENKMYENIAQKEKTSLWRKVLNKIPKLSES